MFVENLRLLGIGEQPEFSSEYIFPMAIILLSAIPVFFIGYKIKEELGAIAAPLICAFIVLYMKDLFKIPF